MNPPETSISRRQRLVVCHPSTVTRELKRNSSQRGVYKWDWAQKRAFKEHIAKTIKEFFGKYEYGDIRTGIEFVPLDTTKYTRFHRELAAKSVVIDANLHYVDQHRKSLQRDYKTFDEYRLRTLPYLRLQLKALIARDLWEMNEYFTIMGEANDALQRALQII